jgi:tetratricopeptide (TPR) repeat protein
MLQIPQKLRATTILGSVLCIALLLLAPAAEAGKKKGGGKKGQKQQGGQENPPPSGGGDQGTPAGPTPPEVGQAERKLVEYKTGEARGAINGVADQADRNAAVSVALGRVLDQEKKYGEAAARLRKAGEIAPSDPAPWVYLGESYLHDRKSGEADAAFRKAADLAQGGGRDADYFLGVAQQRLRQFDSAVETLERARSKDPGNPLIPFQIGMTRVFQEQWQPAVDQLNKALEMDSGIAYAYYYRGLAAEKIGRKDLLVNDLERFLALAPNAPEADRAKAVLRAAQR